MKKRGSWGDIVFHPKCFEYEIPILSESFHYPGRKPHSWYCFGLNDSDAVSRITHW